MLGQKSKLSVKLKRSSGCICLYNSQELEQDQLDKHQPVLNSMPMLSRQRSSGIKFKNIEHNNKQPIYEILNQLYEDPSKSSRIYELLSTKRINPVIHGNDERDDIEYFIPQIITFMVIEKNLTDEELVSFVIKGCTTDFYFAHRVYFYLNSLSVDHTEEKISNVWEFLTGHFLEKMEIYSACRLSGFQFTKSMIQMDPEFPSKRKFSEDLEEFQNEKIEESKMIEQGQMSVRKILAYGTRSYPEPRPELPPTIRKVVKKKYCENGFMETPQFWEDLLQVGNIISLIPKNTPQEQRDAKLHSCVQEINEKLPANVYIPFFKEGIRLHTILCIWKGRLFATKERAPFSIWVQIYREQQELNLQKIDQIEQLESTQKTKEKKKKNILEKIYDTISRPFNAGSGKNTLNIKRYITEKLSLIDESLSSTSSLKKNKKAKKSISKSFADENFPIFQAYQQKDKQQTKSQRLSSSVNSSVNEQQPQLSLDEFFGQNSNSTIEQIKRKSIYRELKSWKLIHMMIKTGDDIKQQQFAMQLINRFQYIFNKENLQCVVFPYEVISLGPREGLIEMLNNITTLNSLYQKFHAKNLTLAQFYRKAFMFPEQAKRNFMHSLAGYSILTYFLQVKDRHNGNILITRDGHIIHIDFGFFLSNAPGKGVQLQAPVPFKFISDYVQVLGGMNSETFFQFRRLFYKGFSAILKHKDSILTLVKMMYSSHGESMGCFIKGEEAIEQLQKRFDINQGVESFCYDLINKSFNNWRAKWYDKFQYFLQKIYY